MTVGEGRGSKDHPWNVTWLRPIGPELEEDEQEDEEGTDSLCQRGGEREVKPGSRQNNYTTILQQLLFEIYFSGISDSFHTLGEWREGRRERVLQVIGGIWTTSWDAPLPAEPPGHQNCTALRNFLMDCWFTSISWTNPRTCSAASLDLLRFWDLRLSNTEQAFQWRISNVKIQVEKNGFKNLQRAHCFPILNRNWMHFGQPKCPFCNWGKRHVSERGSVWFPNTWSPCLWAINLLAYILSLWGLVETLPT